MILIIDVSIGTINKCRSLPIGAAETQMRSSSQTTYNRMISAMACPTLSAASSISQSPRWA